MPPAKRAPKISPLRSSTGLFAFMKRFSDTSRFSEPWYQTLPPILKCAFEYIWANCDNAGVWVSNYPLAEFVVGGKVDWDEFLKSSDGRLIRTEKTWVLVGFVEMQFGNLNPDSRVHKSVIDRLKIHGMWNEEEMSIAYPIGYQIAYHAGLPVVPRERERTKTSTEGVKGESKRKPDSIGTVLDFFDELKLTASDAEAWWAMHQENGWTTKNKPIKDWKQKARQWFHSGYHPSQNRQPGKETAEPKINYWEPPDAANIETFADSVKRRVAEAGFTFDDSPEEAAQ